ncbi:DNA repair protein RHP57 [Ceraceosorus bombacis]|uniref:DNA repair protein RHP57 n=1 Tax=Ceraceosorus bombacis TaxID=401625 RepID=A0A0P1BG93_9BASI|nr:DNA repair protein RHP57 [Ceraceosorus bombacis]
MFPLHLSDLPLPPTYYSALQRAGYELETELLLTPLSQVQSKLKHASSGGRRSTAGARVGSSSSSGKPLSARQIESIVNEAAHHLAPKSRTCAAVLRSEGHEWEHANRAGESEQASSEVGTQEQSRSTAARRGLEGDRLSVGDDTLDDLLGGGVRCGMLTEVVGESSSGKTQLLLQLAAATALGPPDESGEADPWALSGGVAIMTPNGRAGAYAIVKRLSEIGDALVRRSLRRRAYRATKRRRYDSLDSPGDSRGSISSSKAPETSQTPVEPTDAMLHGNDALSASAASASKGMRDIVTRARTLIELTDQLKRVALLGTRTPSFPQRALTSDFHIFAPAAGIAVVVSNHVMDAFEKEREIALSLHLTRVFWLHLAG